MTRENGPSSKTVWQTGNFVEVLKDELVVSSGGGGVMQMPFPINALEKWHQHQQWKWLIDDQGRATLYIKGRTVLTLKDWSTSSTLTWYSTDSSKSAYFFLDIRTEDLVREAWQWRSSVISHSILAMFKQEASVILGDNEKSFLIRCLSSVPSFVSATEHVFIEVLGNTGCDTLPHQFTHRG